ncbi:MAG: DNA polymerase III subunit gamma/tau, partial [Pseudomonadota bacterium]
RSLTRMWQMLLKALDEVGRAPNAMMAAEMAVIRLTHVADLPTPEDIVRQLSGQPQPPENGGGGGGGGGGPRAVDTGGGAAQAVGAPAPQPTHRPDPAPRASTEALIAYQSFADVMGLIAEKRDAKLKTDVEDFVRLVAYAPGRIDFAPAPGAPRDLAQVLSTRLQAWTGARWMVSVSSEPGEPSITERKRKAEDEARAEAAAHPLVAAALATFPGAKIAQLRDLSPPPMEEAPPPPLEPDDDDYGDDWSPVDPFAE